MSASTPSRDDGCMNVLPMGPRAMLVEDLAVEPAVWSVALRAMISERRIEGVIDVIPAAETVLVRCEDEGSLRQVGNIVDDVERHEGARAADRSAGHVDEPIVIPVDYDGDDLEDVAARTGRSTGEVVRLHHSALYRVAFCGFAPGFGYLSGLPTELHLPRRASPRTVVPVGAVAIASEFSAVYPRASPGGWHLIGRTDIVMFDPDRRPPALLEPGARVRFEPR